MKYKFSIIMILSVGLFFSGCERDENGRMPDDIKDANTGLLIVNRIDSDPFINLANPLDYQAQATVDLLFEGEFNKIDVVVVYNGDYTKQYLLKTVNSVPSVVTITGQELVDAVEVLGSVDDIQENDVFNLFTSIELKDGTYLPGYTITGTIALAPGIRNIIGTMKGGTPNFLIGVPCEYDENLFLGEFNTVETSFGDVFDYTVTISKDPEYTGPDLGLLIRGIFDPAGEYRVVISTFNYSMTGADMQILFDGPLWPGTWPGDPYSKPTFRDFSDGVANTCDGSISFSVGRLCVHSTATGAYLGCFGGSVHTYKFTRVEEAVPVKKSTILGPVGRPERSVFPDRIAE